jgi:IS605 OrfB family transposase
MSMTVKQAYRFALDPSPAQARALDRHAGAARFAFNWTLAQVKANLAQRAAERSHGIAAEDLTPALGWSLPALRRVWNQAKHEVAPWWPECSKEGFGGFGGRPPRQRCNTGLDGLARGLANWAESKSGERKGRRVGFPRFRSRRRARPSVRFTTGAIWVEADRRHVRLPRLGRIRTHESTRKLARRLEAGTARILSATVRREAGVWFCSFTVEVRRGTRAPQRPAEVVGVDLGVSNLAVLSTGVIVPNPRHLDAAQRKIRSAARAVSRRAGPDRRAGNRPSKRWERACRRLARLHARVANLRRDSLHKLTTGLARGYGTVVVEDLHVAGMLTNRRLARPVADAGFGEIRRQLAYKTTWNGGVLAVADRWFPSSQCQILRLRRGPCSACQTVKPKLSLAARVFLCHNCGLVLDRDLNAARNLERYVARSGRETRNGRGADQKTRPGRAGGCEASTPHRATGQDGDRPLATASCEWDAH